MEEIVVSGIRESLESAQALKRQSDQIIELVVAEDIGKLPDVTASESLARITGVQVERNNGAAQGVRIRGLPDLATTYNGREMFTAGGRFVQLQDFPSNSIARLDVYKSASANLQEAGLAGLVDVRSRRPLDFKEDRVAGGISHLHWYQARQNGIDANLLVSKRWETGIGDMGFLVEGAYADTKFIDSSRAVSQTISNRRLTPTADPIRYPTFVNIDYVTAKRWRPNAATVFQWRPRTDLEFYIDGLFQGYRSKGGGRNLNVGTGDLANLTDIVLFPDSNLVKSFTATAGATPSGGQGVVDGKTDTYQTGSGFIWHGDDLRLTGDVAFTDSTFTTTNFRANYTLRSQPNRSFDFDTDAGVGGGTVTFTNFDLTDPNNYRLTGLAETGDRTHGRSVQARMDADYALSSPWISNLQVGIRYNTQENEAYNFSRNGTAPAGQFYPLLPLEYSMVPPGFRGDDATSIRTFLTPTTGSLTAHADDLRALVNVPAGRPAWGDAIYEGEEQSYTAYLQARYDYEIAGMPIDGLVGLRAVRTENAVTGTARSTEQGPGGQVVVVQPVTRKNAYNDFLPNVSARLRMTPELQFRTAFTKTRTKPGFGALDPSLTINLPPPVCIADPAVPENGPNHPDCVRSASGGNPDLNPVKATNYDASLEYYFSRSGAITVGVFRKDITGFISNFTTEVRDPEFNRLNVNRPENGGEGRIQGIEAGARTFLRAPWLPNWLENVGGMVNYTYLDHASELAPGLAATLPGKQPIAGVSDHVLNMSVFYDTRPLSLRVSYNYRSSYVVSYGQVQDPALGANVLGPTLPVKENGRGTLDFSATFSPVEDITLSFNATNILHTPTQNRRTFNAQGQSYPWQTRFLESVYRVGMRFRL
ncbi:TonB-dependent receptor [Niveispirillum fermenti]|uniref:TonB-dependent receptor n=1 Tax=Niveispirillum fermenti TaxID=1233113 RepID=UPI004042BE90